jgi:hypothetical protein
MQNPMIQNLVQFRHLQKTYGYLPGMSEATVAALFGLDEVTYREIKDHFDERARGCTRALRKPFTCRAGTAQHLPRATSPGGVHRWGFGFVNTPKLQTVSHSGLGAIRTLARSSAER